MSGWDKPSRPTWDPQDGPEDGTQAFPAPDGSGADDRWSQPVGSGWGGTGAVDGQDFGRPDFGASDFGGVNTSGADRGGSDLGRGDLGRADRREPAFPPEPNGFPSDRNGFAPDRNGFAPDRNGFPPDQNGFPPDQNGFAPDRNGFPGDQNGFPRGGASSAPPSDFFPQEFEQRQPGATLAGRSSQPGRSGPRLRRDEPPGPGYASGPRPPPGTSRRGRAPPARNPPRQESARPDYGRAGEYGRDRRVRPAASTAARIRPRRLRPPGRPGPGLPPSRPGPGRLLRLLHVLRTAGSGRAGAPAVNRGDAELAARMDPALQDFFAPTKPDPRYTSGRPSQAAQPPGTARPRPVSGPGQPGPGQPGPVAGGRSRRSSHPAEVTDADPSGGPAARRRPVGGPGQRDRPRPAGRRTTTSDEDEPASQGQAVRRRRRRRARDRGRAGSPTWPCTVRAATPTTPRAAARRPPPASAPTAAAKPNSTGAAKSPNVTGSADRGRGVPAVHPLHGRRLPDRVGPALPGDRHLDRGGLRAVRDQGRRRHGHRQPGLGVLHAAGRADDRVRRLPGHLRPDDGDGQPRVATGRRRPPIRPGRTAAISPAPTRPRRRPPRAARSASGSPSQRWASPSSSPRRTAPRASTRAQAKGAEDTVEPARERRKAQVLITKWAPDLGNS